VLVCRFDLPCVVPDNEVECRLLHLTRAEKFQYALDYKYNKLSTQHAGPQSERRSRGKQRSFRIYGGMRRRWCSGRLIQGTPFDPATWPSTFGL
jgi:hypothetical protein